MFNDPRDRSGYAVWVNGLRLPFLKALIANRGDAPVALDRRVKLVLWQMRLEVQLQRYTRFVMAVVRYAGNAALRYVRRTIAFVRAKYAAWKSRKEEKCFPVAD